MPTTRSQEIREFILGHVKDHPADVLRMARAKFGLSRQAVNQHADALVAEGLLVPESQTRARRYRPNTRVVGERLDLAENADEDVVWNDRIHPHLLHLPSNVVSICNYGFTEMYNNAVEHSGSDAVRIGLQVDYTHVFMVIEDQGVGIFEKLRRYFHLDDHRHALLELSKGKLTTDATRHTGEGIFFTSRIFDSFQIWSNNLAYVQGHQDSEGWLLEREAGRLGDTGTVVCMTVAPDTRRTTVDVFDKYAGGEDYAFSKTHVPLALTRYGSDQLVSRSQAKRVLARFDRFDEVMLDFEGVEMIGQAFADEIFRVYAHSHPHVNIVPLKANETVAKMIRRALGARARQEKEGTGLE